MWQSDVSTDIAAPVDEVFSYLADFPRHKEWSRSVTDIAPVATNDPFGVGSEYSARESVPTKFTSYTRITAVDPPRHIAWDSADRRMMRVEWSFELSPRNSGTHLIQRSHWQPTNVLGRAVFAVMRRRQIPKENRQSLERIKAILEERAS
ncbi:MAG: SRPBCC family protein [Thermomicrobiales bacterium]